ncbi:hypothetical protein AAVH_26849 [Aphelenchoides avenae]|nr:hypothetical protein AAVH_26849 [Aphelenchus avenae]
MDVSKISFYGCSPVDKANFEASDDGALALCFRPRQPDQAEGTMLEVRLADLALAGEFYAKFLQKCNEVKEDER